MYTPPAGLAPTALAICKYDVSLEMRLSEMKSPPFSERLWTVAPKAPNAGAAGAFANTAADAATAADGAGDNETLAGAAVIRELLGGVGAASGLDDSHPGRRAMTRKVMEDLLRRMAA